jgi:endonuclease/exonuclease/phosphatase family metal-dependent hydrolase
MIRLKIATYNIHKCVGIDRKYSPERIVDVLREIDADVVALQEVVCHSLGHKRDHQAEFISEELEMDFRLGENRLHKGGEYGNVVLSRFPIADHKNYDITVKKYEPRGCQRAEIDLGAGGRLQFVNLHMGTSYFERRLQVHRLLASHVLEDPTIVGRRIVAGDFNEWTKGMTTKLFRSNFRGIEPKLHLGKNRTYPGIMPLVHLDHIYFDDDFRLLNAHLHRSRTALFASDHLPIVAEFDVNWPT